MRIYAHNSLDSYIIMLRPRLEEWILEACKEAGIDPQDYDLPRDPDKFHQIVNIRFNEFSKLLRDLYAKNAKRLMALKKKLLPLLQQQAGNQAR